MGRDPLSPEHGMIQGKGRGRKKILCRFNQVDLSLGREQNNTQEFVCSESTGGENEMGNVRLVPVRQTKGVNRRLISQENRQSRKSGAVNRLRQTVTGSAHPKCTLNANQMKEWRRLTWEGRKTKPERLSDGQGWRKDAIKDIS